MLVRRPWDRARRHTSALSALAALLLVQVVLVFGYAALRSSTDLANQLSRQFRASIAPVTASAGTPRPDVYFIVVDGFGRQDTLKSLYGVDLAAFSSFLEQ